MPLISNGDITRIKLTHSGMNLYSSISVYHLPCAENEQDGVKPDIEVKMSLEDLRKELEKAVAGEDYEKAAKLRDEISKRKS